MDKGMLSLVTSEHVDRTFQALIDILKAMETRLEIMQAQVNDLRKRVVCLETKGVRRG